MKKSNLYVFMLCFFMLPDVYSQQIQGGLYVGGINYEGDLAPSSFFVSVSETRLDLGAFMFVKPKDWFALKLNYHHGSLTGSDETSNNVGRRERNLSFWSPLDELSVAGAFFYTFNTKRQRLIEPFLTLGVGVFRFNPQAQYNGKWYALQPLSTEGQGLKNYPSRQPYKRVQICFPLGGGIQTSVTKRLRIALDLSLRKTLTDYLDDVSMTYVPLEMLYKERSEMAAILSNRNLTKEGLQNSTNQSPRGEAKNKDWYIIGSIGIVANILGKNKRNNFFQPKKNYLNCKRMFKKGK